jgi:hypothetical protein
MTLLTMLATDRRIWRTEMVTQPGTRSRSNGSTLLIALVIGCSALAVSSSPAKFEESSPALGRHQNGTLMQTENAKPGDPNWKLTNVSNLGEIQGYASAVSINRGESIQLFVSTIDPGYKLDVYRVGWYQGTGARRMMPTVTLPGIRQPSPVVDVTTGLIECNWLRPYTLNVPANPFDPTDWFSGVYLARMTGNISGKQNFIVFVVRDDSRPSDILFQSSVTTFEAYNDWGGLSLYVNHGVPGYTNPRAYEVSFNRPYAHDWGTGDFLKWEIDMVRFLEREGYDVSYSTDVDTHERGSLLTLHKGFLSVGHDEYWTWRMRDNVENARDNGLNLGFFAANVSYWQIRFQPSPITGVLDRTIVCYKADALEKDPYAFDGDLSHRHLVTTQFRMSPVNRPENAMVGIMYGNDNVHSDIVVTDPSNWVFRNTGVTYGQHLTGLLGYEVDHTYPGSPSMLTILASSPYQTARGTLYANSTVYSTLNSTVFAAGSIQWSWGLDDFNITGRPPVSNPIAQQATRNVLQRFGATLF